MRTSIGAAKAIRVDDRHRRLARRRIIALPNKEIGKPYADIALAIASELHAEALRIEAFGYDQGSDRRRCGAIRSAKILRGHRRRY